MPGYKKLSNLNFKLIKSRKKKRKKLPSSHLNGTYVQESKPFVKKALIPYCLFKVNIGKTMSKYILSIDQGTSSSRVFLFNKKHQIISKAQKEFTQHFPYPGWVEHDAIEIWQSVYDCILLCLSQQSISFIDIASIGITNQRETTVVWNKSTGLPIYNAIVWQSRQTNEICQSLKEQGLSEIVHKKTGLLIDSYFSGPKIRWILDHCKAQKQAEKGELLFGTIDSWLLWKLSGVHATDYSNASRTLIYNIHSLEWDQELLDHLDIPKIMLPKVLPSSHHFGSTVSTLFNNHCIPITGIAGDQQAALFGQVCFDKGDCKNTYGTGCFTLMNTGTVPVNSKNGLLTTIAWGVNGEVTYALEGSVFVAGSAVQWLRDGLQIIDDASESDKLAVELDSNEGVYIVPTFAGLGTPYWKSDVRGACFGLTRGSDRRHFCRATLEAIAYQSRDLLEAMTKDSKTKIASLSVDGGGTNSEFLMQFQSDLLGIELKKPVIPETSVYGAACLAALTCGFWTLDELQKNQQEFSLYSPKQELSTMNSLYKKWQAAIEATILFSERH